MSPISPNKVLGFILRDLEVMIKDAKSARLLPLLPFNGEIRRLLGILQNVNMENDKDLYADTLGLYIEETRKNFPFDKIIKRFN